MKKTTLFRAEGHAYLKEDELVLKAIEKLDDVNIYAVNEVYFVECDGMEYDSNFYVSKDEVEKKAYESLCEALKVLAKDYINKLEVKLDEDYLSLKFKTEFSHGSISASKEIGQKTFDILTKFAWTAKAIKGKDNGGKYYQISDHIYLKVDNQMNDELYIYVVENSKDELPEELEIVTVCSVE